MNSRRLICNPQGSKLTRNKSLTNHLAPQSTRHHANGIAPGDEWEGHLGSAGGAWPSLSRALGQPGRARGPGGSRPLDRVRKGPASATCHTGPIWLAVRGCATSSLRPYGPLRRFGTIKPTARFIRDQRFGGFFICWSCGCCPAVFVCGSDFAGFCIGSCGSGDRFRFAFFWIAENDLTFGFFGFFTGSASAFVTLIGFETTPCARWTPRG